jgi:hypothetical protein
MSKMNNEKGESNIRNALYNYWITGVRVRVLVFNATFKNISVIS